MHFVDSPAYRALIAAMLEILELLPPPPLPEAEEEI